ncbi:MAG: hypothetical protein IPJ19_05465 [Planctomycetes bacterium]|nr:hypothetical protein [Planctomycetota bacterium]
MTIATNTIRLGTLALLVCACTTANRTRTDLPAGPVPETSSPPVLYARDGSVVKTDGRPSTTPAGPAAERSLQEGSRTFMLELYQRAIDEKEALALEIKNLEATLEKSRGELAASIKEKEELQKKHDELETERVRLQDENFDLAGRLVTAQIRRLESEKILLESKIEWQRLAEKTRPASAPREDAGDKPAAEEKKP